MRVSRFVVRSILPGGFVLLLGFILGLSGCMGSVSHAEVFVLSLRYETDAEGGMAASPGPHCGTARVRDDVVHLEERSAERLSQEPAMLVVRPSLGPGWATMGYEGYARAFPTTLTSGVEGHEGPLVDLGFEDNQVLVDGVAVDVPHEWRLGPEDGDWWVDARLERGPQQVQTFQLEYCE